MRNEARELMEFLRLMVPALGHHETHLAHKARVPPTIYFRSVTGGNDPKLSVVFAIVRALGLSIREFFELAYPPEEEPTQARLTIEKFRGRLLGSPPPAKPERKISAEELERVFDRIRAELLPGS